MSILPDEIWSRIMEIGTETSRLSCRDLCSIAIACRRFKLLAGDPKLWSSLLAVDFPQQSPSSSSLPRPPPVALYRTSFERDKERRLHKRRLAKFNAESELAICSAKLENLKSLILQEGKRIKVAGEELSHLERVSQKSFLGVKDK